MSPNYTEIEDQGALVLDSQESFEALGTESIADSDRWAFVPAALSREHVKVAAYETTKRLLDIVLSAAALVVLAPLFALAALAVKIEDGGQVLFVQTRVGKDGRRFRFYKFRSMIPSAEELKSDLLGLNRHADPRTFKIVDDPRITRVGRYLRRFSLDEFPQLWNVLIGDMSLVGPRPPVPREVEIYTRRDWRRLEVRPGLTCLWQVSGRSELPFEQQVRLDIAYIENRGIGLDLKLMALTVPAILTGRGAY